MLKRLDDSFTRLSQFSADLAHELRTPIANMLGEAQVALTRDRTAADYRETVESTVTECERLSRIVDNLLFVARVDAAREPIARKQFDARAEVEKIAEFYQTVADDRHVTITCSGTDKFTQTRIYSNAPLGICSTTHCASLPRMVQFKLRFANTRLILKSPSAIMAAE
jgi:Signal transduction histidine kinase